MNVQDYCFPSGYQVLRSLSHASPVFLCRENASDRLLVIKFVPTEKKRIFQNEVGALAALEEFPYAPRLYFAVSDPSSKSAEGAECHYLGLQYRHGRSLVELQGSLDAMQISEIAKGIEKSLETLHKDWGFVHGDLSPKNILVHFLSGSSSCFETTLIDWEFSEKIHKQTLLSYSQYRGTVGFGNLDTNIDPVLKEWQAFEACMRFLDPGEVAKTKPQASRRKRWGIWT